MKQLFIFLFFLPSVLFADIQCPDGYRLWNVFPDLGYKKLFFPERVLVQPVTVL